ncbi:MAG TPA: discoidin domain-containing protein, partial [Planctomycetota bacterium]|nr:discoidin domain-containing protein [Planctomycetota bacterium]
MRRACVVMAAVLVVCMGYVAFAEITEIPGKGTTWVADALNQMDPVAQAIDGNDSTWWQGNALPTWLRINLGARYRVQRYDFKIRDANHVIKNYEIYVTDDTTTNKAAWGTPAAVGTLPNTSGPFSVPLIPTNGQYVILYAASVYANNANIREATLYGDAVSPVMVPSPRAIRMYTNTTADPIYSVTDPPDPAATIKADIEVEDLDGTLASVVINGTDVLIAGGTDVMTFDGDPNWECKEGAITIT